MRKADRGEVGNETERDIYKNLKKLLDQSSGPKIQHTGDTDSLDQCG